MDRPIMIVFHTLKARTSPTRAELCWFMDGVLPVLSRSCYWVPDSPWGSILAVWGGGRGLAGLPHLQLHQDNALPITREAAAAQRQPWQTELRSSPHRSLYPTSCVFLLGFGFCHGCWVSTVAPKGVSLWKHHHMTQPGEPSAYFLVQRLPGNHTACKTHKISSKWILNEINRLARLLISEIN